MKIHIGAILAVLAPAALAAPQNVNNCRTITDPGSYVLTRNVAAAGNCLVVQADFVTIDLDGFTIAGNGTGMGITDLNAPRRGITVRNGTVAGFSRGVDLSASRDVMVERVRAVGNAGIGILLGTLGTVTGSFATDNGSAGIVTGNGSTIIGNTVGSNETGISGGFGVSVINNTSRSNRVNGISVECPSLVLGNAATANAVDVRLGGLNECKSEHNSTGGDPDGG